MSKRESCHAKGPRVFVAMPFGKRAIDRRIRSGDQCARVQADNAVWVDFDEIWRELLRPALEQAGCTPFRADEEVAAGDIRTDMYFELVTGEFVLADISTLNPNVLYELGVRHGVCPHGVLIITGGWELRPFDVAPDRTFSYNGALFECSGEPETSTAGRGEQWIAAVKKEAASLAVCLADAIANDERTTSSPVYKELIGLRPVDWSNVQNSKARYFGGQLQDWYARVCKAKRQSHIGDILTLSRDAPNRFIQRQLQLDAARALMDLDRPEHALELLRRLVDENPESPEVRYALAKTLHQLTEKPENSQQSTMYAAWWEHEIKEAIRLNGDDAEAYRMLGRIYKYRWRKRWESGHDPQERCRMAAEYWKTAEKSLAYYREAQSRDMRMYAAGLNVLSLLALKTHLKPAETDYGGTAVDRDLIGLVKTCAGNVLAFGRNVTVEAKDESDTIWANAVLGEIAFLVGESDHAKQYLQRAVTDPEVSVSQLVSFDDQFCLYEQLGYKVKIVKSLRQIVRDQVDCYRKKHTVRRAPTVVAGEQAPYGVVAFRGESFRGGPMKNGIASRMPALADECHIGEGSLVVSGARRGLEILFLEECLRRKAQVKLLLAKPKSVFVAEAVHVEGEDWERRFYVLIERCEVLEQHLRLGLPPAQSDAYERNNSWCLEIARTECEISFKPHVIAMHITSDHVADPIDSRGSLEHFERTARDLELPVERINVSRPGSEPTLDFIRLGFAICVRRKDAAPVVEPLARVLNIGRAGDNHLILSDPAISRYHLRLVPDQQGVRLTNLSQHPNKTFLDDAPLLPDPAHEVMVKVGQTIKLSDGTLIEILPATPIPSLG